MATIFMFTEQGLLPILNQNPSKISANSLPNGALPPVPMVTGCRTQGQIAVTYVRIKIFMLKRKNLAVPISIQTNGSIFFFDLRAKVLVTLQPEL
jgi:hypothetical protein